MKKKFLSLLSISLGVLIFSSFVTACNNDRPLHIWAEDWSYNNATHWHACTDAGCPGKDAYDYHDFALVSTTVESTCTKEGEGHYRCSICGYEKDDSIPVIPHNYKLVQTLLAPSCIYEGRGTFECEVCQHREDLQIPATGKHSYGRLDYDDNNHWHVCLTEGCGATDDPVPHVAGSAATVSPTGWIDGRIVTACKDCGYTMSEVAIPNDKAPASYDMVFINAQTNTTATPIPGDEEYGQKTYKLILKTGLNYTINLLNAKNAKGESINLRNDTAWLISDIYNTHGLKVYSVDMRSGKETVIESYSAVDGFRLAGSNITASNAGEHKLIFRYETGVNDGNGNTRQIRVEHIVYVTVVQAA